MIGHYTATSEAEITVRSTWHAMLVQVDEYGAGKDTPAPVEIEGKTKFAAEYQPIATIKLADYSVVETPDADGLYMLDVDGLDFVKFTFVGSNVYYNVV